MAVKLPMTYKDGVFLGDMTPQQAETILAIRDMKEVENLKYCLYNFPLELVEESLERCKSIRSILEERGEDITKYYGKLRDYQTVGTAFIYMSPRSILADFVGLGKTAEIAALLNFLKIKNEMGRFLMAVETSALGQTQCELTKFTGLNVVALPSEAPKMKKAIMTWDWENIDGVVIKHSALRSDVLSTWLSVNINPQTNLSTVFDVFILDESSVVKHNDTKVYRYTRNIANLVPRMHMMNATTFETHLKDIYNQMDLMHDRLLPLESVINKTYCKVSQSYYWTRSKGGEAKRNTRWDITGYKNQEEFKSKIKLVYFGRSKKDVGLDLPHVYKVNKILPTTEQMMAINKGYRYMEVLNCPSLIPELLMKTTRETVPKIDRLCTIVENEFIDSKIMIYAFHKEAQEAIAKEMIALGKNPVILNGDIDEDYRRYEIQNQFNNGDKDVIITNIKKSLNLHAADACIFYSAITNPAAMFQAAGRIDRSVDDRIKTYILLLYDKTKENDFFMQVVSQRSQDAKDLTIDAETAVDFFIKSMTESE